MINKLALIVFLGLLIGMGAFYTYNKLASQGDHRPVIENTPPPIDTAHTVVMESDTKQSTSTIPSATDDQTGSSSLTEKLPSPTIPSSTPDRPTKEVQDKPVITSSVPSLVNLEVMAWIYPSAPGCKAASEFSDGRSINVLKPEFFAINDGLLTLLDSNNSECNGYSSTFVREIRKYSSKQYVTVSSASTYGMDSFFSDQQIVTAGVETLVTFVVSNNLTGIELDFEDFGGWSETSYKNFKDFVNKLGSALHGEGKKLMLDGPAIADDIEQTWFLWDYSDFVTLPVDVIVIMTYDYQFDHGAGEPIAPLEWMKRVINRTVSYYPKNKLSVGIPSYGYEATIGKRPIIRTYDQLKGEYDLTGATRESRSGEMTWRSGKKVYFYQDSESVRQKIAVAKAAGINSVSIWHLGGNLWF